ncbi:Uncharacterised protein [Shigella sonnei]|nr:Uncharacterised protein [Shigella sonnei]
MHRFCGVHRKGHPGRENAAHHRQHQPFFQIELFGFNAHLALFQLPGSSYNPYANQRHQNAEQRHASAFGVNQHIEIAVDNWRHQRTDNQRNANGDANSHRHAEITHGQAIVDITDPPHSAEQKNRQQRRETKRAVIRPEIR